MPKVTGTRVHKAADLLGMLERGPSFSSILLSGEPMSLSEAERQYRLWANSWIIPLVKQLVPELRSKAKDVIHA